MQNFKKIFAKLDITKDVFLDKLFTRFQIDQNKEKTAVEQSKEKE